MDGLVLGKLGTYFLMVFEALFVYLAFFIGHSVNGIPLEVAVLFGSILTATDILGIFLIKYFFKMN